MKKQIVQPIALGSAAVLVSALAMSVNSAENPFSVKPLDSGYELAMHHEKAEDGKKADGKCGEGKCGEGKCGGDKKASAEKSAKKADGKCGEGKCGEGKCGGAKGE